VYVYCASSDGVAARNVELAEAVSTAVAARGWTLVSGGGRRSMMGAVARGARQGGARTVGVISRSMVEREWADELLITDTMRERKGLMDAHANAVLTLPGGIGTLEELFETWSAGVLELHDKPVVLLDPHGHYTGLLTWMRELVMGGFARPGALDRLVITKDMATALDACAP
jgi:uncharacterized protein (TIGR00730 family)